MFTCWGGKHSRASLQWPACLPATLRHLACLGWGVAGWLFRHLRGRDRQLGHSPSPLTAPAPRPTSSSARRAVHQRFPPQTLATWWPPRCPSSLILPSPSCLPTRAPPPAGSGAGSWARAAPPGKLRGRQEIDYSAGSGTHLLGSIPFQFNSQTAAADLLA